MPDGSVAEDRLARLERENTDLKKANAEKVETVKKMGVQLIRIRNDWQQQATPKDLAPVAKARAHAEASKADRISELQVELSQREAREERLQQQLQLLKQQAGGVQQPGRPISRQRRLVRAQPGTRSASGTGGSQLAPAGAIPSGSERQLAHERGMPPAGSASEKVGTSASVGGDMRSLLEMLQDKDRSLEELRARLALQEEESAKAHDAGEREIREAAALGSGVLEGAVGAELRRQLKKAQFELSLLDQRYQHLDARFNTLRDNHEKVPHAQLRSERLR